MWCKLHDIQLNAASQAVGHATLDLVSIRFIDSFRVPWTHWVLSCFAWPGHALPRPRWTHDIFAVVRLVCVPAPLRRCTCRQRVFLVDFRTLEDITLGRRGTNCAYDRDVPSMGHGTKFSVFPQHILMRFVCGTEVCFLTACNCFVVCSL